MKLLVKLMVIFSTLYAVGALLRNGRISWPFAFVGTAVTGLLGIAGDRILMPKMKRWTAVWTDVLLIMGSLFAAKWMVREGQGVDLPYIGTAAAVLGGFESVFHEWVYNREAYQELADSEGGH